MTRGNKCSVCASENLAQIDAYLQAGCKQKDIAAQFPGLSPFAISRHKRNCIATPAATQGSPDALEQQIGTWLARSEALWNSGAANLDSKAQIAAISTAMRALEFASKNQTRVEEKIAASRVLPTDGSALTADECQKFGLYMDSLVEAAAKTDYASTEVKSLHLEITMAKNPELLDVMMRLIDDPTLLSTVQNLMRGAA